MKNYKSLLYASALAGVLPLVSGCFATRGYVREQVGKAQAENQEAQRRLEHTVDDIRIKSIVDSPTPFCKGRGYDEEFGMIKGVVTNKFQVPESKKIAEDYGNMVYIIPTNDGNLYYGVVMVDNDRNCIANSGDRTLPDKRGEEQFMLIPITEKDLTRRVEEWVINQGHRDP